MILPRASCAGTGREHTVKYFENCLGGLLNRLRIDSKEGIDMLQRVQTAWVTFHHFYGREWCHSRGRIGILGGKILLFTPILLACPGFIVL